MQCDKVLILSGDYGEGHQQAAKAIRESLNMNRPDVEVIHADFMELAHPYFHLISRYLFVQGIKTFPGAYGFLFDKTRSPNHFSYILKKLNRLGSGRLLKVLQTVRPSIVVSTFPLAAGAMSMLKSNGLTAVPTATVITDHTDHSYWVYPHTDHYIVGSEAVKQGLLQYEIPAEQIAITGIPIRMEFSRQYDREELVRRYGLEPQLPTILLMGGGCGLFGDSTSMVKALEALPYKIQMIVVCGRNHKLQQQLKEMLAASKHRVHILGYIENVSEMMAVSDLMISKPGGLTISEALAMELPMVIYNPLPGQEEDNAKFLLQSGAALQAQTLSDLGVIISKALQHSDMLVAMRARARLVQRKWASLDAVRVILQHKHIEITSIERRKTWHARFSARLPAFSNHKSVR